MTMPETYLAYTHRHYGMDQDRYAWRPSVARAPIAWPGGQALAAMIVVPIEHHMLNPSGKPFKHPGAMVTPYPDLRHYTTRDYGLRVGAFRILDALKAAGLKATFPVNARQLGRLRPLIEAILASGHEIAAYGLSTDHIHWGGLDRAVEAAWVSEVRELFDTAGLEPRAWLSPARQQSFATLDLIAEAGFDVCLYWENDEVPLSMATTGGAVTALPLSNELDDRILLIDRRQTEDEWSAQVLEAADYLAGGADSWGGRMLGFTLTPYVAGQPFRIAALRALLGGLAEDARVWTAGASQIADAARPQI
jgi:peptidoglycan/xylan/chitin deacetylase (PgdA/CDA1 family)